MKDKEKLPASQKIGVLFVAIVSAIATGYIPNYINLYYTDTVGVSIGAIGAILMASKITDGVTDIIMGMILDRTHTRLGKARPWVLAGAAGLVVTMLMLFHCPQSFGMGGKIAFCTVLYFLANPFFGTMVSVASGTLPNLITADNNKRATVGVFRSIGSMIPTLLIGLLVPQMLARLGENQHAYDMITLMFAALSAVSAIIAVVLIREAVTERSEANLTQKQPVGQSLKDLFTNKYFIFLALGTIFYNLSTVPVMPYYAKYIFHDVGKMTTMSIPSMFMIVLLPAALPLVRKVGKRASMVGGLLVAALGSVLIFFANDSLTLFMIGKSIACIGVVPYFVALVPVMGEVCDYALWKSGKPMDGTISSANSMGEKIGIGLSAGLSSILLNAAHYQSSTAAVNVVQPHSAIMMLRFQLGLLPAILFIISAFFFSLINMKKAGIDDIQRELREKGLR